MPSPFSATGLAWILAGSLLFVACGPAPIHVNGVVRESPEMRPLRNIAHDAYKDLRVFAHAASERAQQGSECGVAPLEGSGDHNNAACVPADASNDAIRLVRQRLRSYGVGVARDANEAYDYDVQVTIVGVAPSKPDPTLVKAAAKLTFALHPNSGANGVFAGVDRKAASVGFDSVAKDCALQDADISTFSASSTQPMTPEFDLAVLAGDVVDNVIGCDQLARFFLDVKTQYPSVAAAGQPAAPATH